MPLNYDWSIKDESNYCIRKKDSEAGKEFEKTGNQTIDTHFFMWVDETKKNKYELYKINAILKTITYEYYYINEGKEEESKKKYLTQKDIDKVIKNIDRYKNGVVRINTTPPKNLSKKEILKEHKKTLVGFFKTFKENKTTEDFIKTLFDLINKRNEKQAELKKKRQEAKDRIKKINADLALFENETNKEIAELERDFYKKTKNIFNYKETDIRVIRNDEDFKNKLYSFTEIVKTYNAREARNERQKNYRKRKNEKSGKPIRKKGRPRKNKT